MQKDPTVTGVSSALVRLVLRWALGDEERELHEHPRTKQKQSLSLNPKTMGFQSSGLKHILTNSDLLQFYAETSKRNKIILRDAAGDILH